MAVVEGSVLGRLWLVIWHALTRWYEGSLIHRGLAALSRGWGRWFHGSALMTWFCREGRLVTAWRSCVVQRVLSWLVNLPANLLHRLYRRFQGAFEGSLLSRLVFAMGRETISLTFWVGMVFFAMFYEYCNNMFSFAGFVVITLLFILGGMRRKEQRLDLVSTGPYLAFFVGAVALSWLLSYDPSDSFKYLFFHLTCILCVVVTVSAARRREDLARLCGAACAVVLFIGGYGVIQGIQGVPVNYSYTDVAANAGMPGRIYSVYENPNTFAQALVMLVPLAAVLMYVSRSRWGKLAGALATVLGVASIAMTYSRSSYVGIVVALVVYLFFWKRKLLPGLVVLAAVCVPLLPSAVFNRILSIFNAKDSSTASRTPLYQAALELIGSRPVQGAGLGSSVVRTAIKDLNTYHGKAAFVHAHNLLLQLWLETGFLGVLTFTGGMISSVKSAVKAVNSPACDRKVKAVTVAGAAAVCGVLVNSMADYIWNYPRVMLIFWFVFAVMMAGMKVARQEAGE